ncbi:hypothetical protein GS489_00005, partial [Rhodococcus hoagii]|nr:hypothetical protein [Prescottella equi]
MDSRTGSANHDRGEYSPVACSLGSSIALFEEADHGDTDPGDGGTGPRGRRGGPRERLGETVLRQGTVPRAIPARPRPSLPPARPRRGRTNRRLPRRPRAVLPGDRRVGDRAGRPHPRRVRRRVGRTRLLRLKVPVEYGGLGLSQVAYNRALMVVSSVHGSLGALLSAHQSIGVPEPLKLAGTEEQKKKFLPRCAKGAISAFLLTEPDVGSDPARMASTATPTDDGSAYLLDGVKLWTTNGWWPSCWWGWRGCRAARGAPG